MVPGAVVFLHQLPVTPNGKIDRNVLPAQVRAISTTVIDGDSPRNETEELLAAIWTEILGSQHLSIHDDFFALGGDSLSATRLMASVLRTFQVELPISAVFRAPTIARLAALIATCMHSARGTSADASLQIQLLNPHDH
jgi:acyl carrier protein